MKRMHLHLSGQIACAAVALIACSFPAFAQDATPAQRVERLAHAIDEAQTQINAYQLKIEEMQRELAALKSQLGSPIASPPEEIHAAIPLNERVETVEAQIATHDLAKVETASKYPVTITGTILLNGFVNTRRVDVPATPTYALRGGGSTGLSMRQTVLGLDARGPHLWGASSSADIRVDFFGNVINTAYSAGGILRMRTAHAALSWKNTQAFFSYDRPLLSPETPTSLTALAVPLLAWSGNLWSWNPQIGASQTIPVTETSRITVQGAFLDVADPLFPTTANPNVSTMTERSRWPSLEARIGYNTGDAKTGPQFGLGGYFSPHRTTDGDHFNAWAATADLRFPIGRYLQITAQAYRGAGLGGLGGGGWADYLYQNKKGVPTIAALNDVGGWTQIKLKTARFDNNIGFGLDNPFANQIHTRAAGGTIPNFFGLTRNSTFFANTIYSPSAYIQLSLEYKRLQSTQQQGERYSSDAIGVSAAYKF